MGLKELTGGYKGLRGVTRGYRGYNRLQGLTGGYKGLQGGTKHYRNLFCSYNVVRYSFFAYFA